MIITWYGQSCFKIQSGSIVVIIDPFKPSLGLTPPKVEAQLVLVTHDHSDHNNVKTIKGEPFIINSPGEYEYQGVRVEGVESFHDDEEGKVRGLNTIYRMRLENISLVHLGDLGQDKLEEEQMEALGEVDILFVPVGGNFTIDGERAIEIINQIEPKIAIPMHYKIKGLEVKLDSSDVFLKAIGKKDLVSQEKLTIKKKDLPSPEDKMDIVLLKP